MFQGSYSWIIPVLCCNHVLKSSNNRKIETSEHVEFYDDKLTSPLWAQIEPNAFVF